MGEEGADADHVRPEVLEESDVLHDVRERLPGRPDHDARPDLIADVPQRVETRLAVRAAEVRRMEHRIMRLVGRLVAQEIAVGAGIEKALVALAGLLPDRERDRAVRERRADVPHDLTDAVVREIRVLAALEHERPKPEGMSLPAARQDLVLGETIARGGAVAAPDAAIVAVVPAIIGELDQAAHIDVRAVALPPDGVGRGAQGVVIAVGGQQVEEGGIVQVVRFSERVDQHGRYPPCQHAPPLAERA